MASSTGLTSREQWTDFLLQAGVPAPAAQQYSETLTANRLTDPSFLSKEILMKDLGFTVLGDVLCILQHARKYQHNTPKPHNLNIPLPTLKSDITQGEFRKFKIDWNVYKSLTNTPSAQIAAQLYAACDSSVQSAIINTHDDFFTKTEEAILQILEKLCTKRSNPTVHRLTFSNLTQAQNEPIQDFVIRLRSAAKDCEFSCPSCHHDLSAHQIKDQLIRGLYNSALQTDTLAKATTLDTLESVIKNAEAFEAALSDQGKLTERAEAMKLSDYKRQGQRPRAGQHNSKSNNSNPKQRKCTGCGSSHGLQPRNIACPAWGKNCLHCGTQNHFAKVCKKKATVENIDEQDDNPESLIAHVHINSDGTYSSISSLSTQQIPATIVLQHDHYTTNPKSTTIFPDSGASICIAGPQHLTNLGLSPHNLTLCAKKVMAVGGSILTCLGWIKAKISVGKHTTQQTLYICNNIDRIYLSRRGCTELNILPPTFPYPMDSCKPEINAISGNPHLLPPKCRATIPPPHPTSNLHPPKGQATIPPPHPTSNNPHPPPKTLPVPPVEENVPKLKQTLIDEFPQVFHRSTPFMTMKCKPVHIHIKPNATPVARHTPVPIPIHWREQVKESLDRDVRDGIIEPVPIGEPVTWCSPMVVTAKKDGTPRRTVDLQKLNAQCSRETHHCESPFKLASQVPGGTVKTVVDATDGYHSIPLDEESRPLTTFITEWGRYRYKRLPQGFVAAGDAYTRRYDEVIKDINKKVKCVDDTLLYDDNIHDAFYHTWEYLSLCELNGITLNENKFQFAQSTVDFAGLKITEKGIGPSDKILTAIKNFPRPKDITGARSWFGLVNQIAWAYSNAEAMQPFRDLVRKKTTFYWDETLENLFEESKKVLIEQSTEGVRTFDTTKNTCLQTDWSKTRDGIGYFLLQQHCSCPISQAPTCCVDGWKLVFAGSRFTKGAETRYSPTEGEALAVAWALEHAKMFVLGCNKLLVATDHEPLLGILNDRSLQTITNTRLLNLKQKTLMYNYTILYNPKKWNRAADALSRNPVPTASIHAIYGIEKQREKPLVDYSDHAQDEEIMRIASLHMMVTDQELETAASEDPTYNTLLSLVIRGFPQLREDLDPKLKTLWNVRHRLSYEKNIVMLDDRILIPSALRPHILNTLHSAHQGVSSMLGRATQTVYWPGMEADIRNKRYSCKHCNEHAPSQPKEPYCPSPSPQYPFQQVCIDYFEKTHHSYLACVDRFTGWLSIYHFPNQATGAKLVTACRDVFSAYGVPEEVSSDGGPQLTSHEFDTFLRNWGIRHRVSSVGYPQSNGRAELAVKTAKRIIQDNTNPDGSLNSDKAARAILQHRNTPIPELGLSPAQLLLHRQLRDSVPARPKHYKPHKEWIISAEKREQAFAERNKKTEATYNEHVKPLSPIAIQTPVLVQEKGRWSKSGKVIEVLTNRQYRIRMDGSGRVTLRNRNRIKPISQAAPNQTPSALPLATPATAKIPTIPIPPLFAQGPIGPTLNQVPSSPSPTHPPPSPPHASPPPQTSPPPTLPDPPTGPRQSHQSVNDRQQGAKLPRSLKALADHNNRGLLESTDARPRLRGGKEH